MSLLKKWPENEMEYWQSIEALGGYVWSTVHNIARGRIKDLNGEIGKFIKEVQDEINKLVAELDEKFGVVLVNPAPEGKIQYWDWYHKMKKEFYKSEYDKIICSACPLSEGGADCLAGGQIPCSVFPGWMNRLSPVGCGSFICGMLTHEWSWSKLKTEIFKKGGEEAVKRFMDKLNELMLSHNIDPNLYTEILANEGRFRTASKVREKKQFQQRYK